MGEKISGRSHCAHCRHELNAGDLIPLVSYLALMGKCRYCGRAISPRYFIIELATGFLFALSWRVIDPNSLAAYFHAGFAAFVLAVLITVFVIDLEHYLILDEIIFPAALAVTLANIVTDILARQPVFSWHSHFVLGLGAALAAALPFFALWFFSHGKWMGFGDVKLMLFLGPALGWPGVFIALFISFILGGALAAILLAVGAKGLKSRLPFGTFLALGSAATLLYGEKLFHWYLGLLGF